MKGHFYLALTPNYCVGKRAEHSIGSFPESLLACVAFVNSKL